MVPMVETMSAIGEAPEGQPENLDKVYAEASHWVRLSNQIIWQMASVFVTLSLGSIGLAINSQGSHGLRIFFAAASVLLFSVWVYVSHLYRETSTQARDVLMEIEAQWNVPLNMATDRTQGQVARRVFSLLYVQIASLGTLILFWILFLRFVR